MKQVTIPAVAILLLCAPLCAQSRPASEEPTSMPQSASSPSTSASGPGGEAASTEPSVIAAPPSGPVDLRAQAILYAAQSLVYAPKNAPYWAGRLIVLSKCAQKLAPANIETLTMLARLYELEGKTAEAAQVAQQRLAANPDDYGAGLDYLRLSLSSCADAQERLGFLDRVCANDKVNQFIRAQAYVQAAEILVAQNKQKEAAKKYAKALELDPYLPLALSGRLSLQPKPTDVDRLKTLLDLIRACPADVSSAWDLGVLLDSMALYDKSVVFLGYAWELAGQADKQGQTTAMAVQYFNALLDAGQSRQAIELFVPTLKKFGQSPELLSLVAEAYRMIGDEQQAMGAQDELIAMLRDREEASRDPKASAREIAWYYLVAGIRANSALAYAKKAAKDEQPDDALELIMGTAQLQTDQAAEGVKRLRKLVDKDVYAAAFLARYYYQNGQSDEGKKAILAGAKLSYRGRAFRWISDLAKRQGVQIPPPPLAKQALEALGRFDARYLDMGQFPFHYLQVAMQPVYPVFMPMEPLLLDVALINRSDMDIPLGPGGLVIPVMSLEVATEGRKNVFNKLPMVVWPAPRYLPAGRSVVTRVRLDVGELQEYLAHRPMDNITLTVTPTLDPVERGQNLQSSLPSMMVPRATITRCDILGEFDRAHADWEAQYELALGYILKDMTQGELPERILAARQVGSLLTLVADLGARKGVLPKQLSTKVKQPMLLSLMRKSLQDTSPVVRAEMIASLDYCPLDTNVLRQLSACDNDKDPLVRLRLVELLGISGGQKKHIAAFAGDADPFVKQMYDVFQK